MKLYEAINVLKKLYEEEERLSFITPKGTSFKSLPYNDNMVNPIVDCFLSNIDVVDKKGMVKPLRAINIEAASKVVDAGFGVPNFIKNSNEDEPIVDETKLNDCCGSDEKRKKTLAALILYNAVLQDTKKTDFFDKYYNKAGYEENIDKLHKDLSDNMKHFNEFKEEAGLNKKINIKVKKEEKEENLPPKDKKEENLPPKDKKEEKISLNNEIDYENWDKFLPHDEEENHPNYDELAEVRNNIQNEQIKLKGFKKVLKIYNEKPDDEKKVKEASKDVETSKERLQKLITKYIKISNKKD